MGGSNKNDHKNNDTSTNVTAYSLNTLPSNTLGQTKPSSTLVVDTGASNHFLQQSDLIHCALPVENIQPNPQGIHVLLPNKATMRSTHTATIKVQGLPEHALTAHVFPQLASGSLLSVGQLCGGGCTATFDKISCTSITKVEQSCKVREQKTNCGKLTAYLNSPTP